ncbi:hypothetical protein BDV26DRAFT_250055 [Aspergillus bertholletiae]|uniref:Uncharacterized protein n=1 Tax=Aspergillus bertholletiae TaxID=1226010 RepID=A0A5N7B1H1_9EURO|nr:hypothetical protein BDV26DRAFT_250055 [Aspergillus bertholletiae]
MCAGMNVSDSLMDTIHIPITASCHVSTASRNCGQQNGKMPFFCSTIGIHIWTGLFASYLGGGVDFLLFFSFCFFNLFLFPIPPPPLITPS